MRRCLVLTANRGLCGGYNGNLIRAGQGQFAELARRSPQLHVGSVRQARHLRRLKFRGIAIDQTYTQFEDKPTFDEVELLANRYLGRVHHRQTRPLGRRLHEVREHLAASRDRGNAAAAGFARYGRLTKRADKPDRGHAVRVPAVARKHPGRGRSDQFQSETVQVLPRFGGQRADRPHGRDEERHRKRRTI